MAMSRTRARITLAAETGDCMAPPFLGELWADKSYHSARPDHPLRQLSTVLDAVRHGDAAEEVAADVEAGEKPLDLAGAFDEAAVADLVLGDGPGPAADEVPGGLAAEAQGVA